MKKRSKRQRTERESFLHALTPRSAFPTYFACESCGKKLPWYEFYYIAVPEERRVKKLCPDCAKTQERR